MKKFVQQQLSRLRRHTYNDWLQVLGKDSFIVCITKLDDVSLVSCILVCKAWREAASDNVLWVSKIVMRFPKEDTLGTITANEQALKEYKRLYLARLEQKREMERERERQRQRLLDQRKRAQMDQMVCRMFHPSNGRDNFAQFCPTIPFEQMPDRDTLIKILMRDNELRLSKDLQDEYWVAEFPSKVTLKAQLQAVEEYGYSDPWIIPSAISYYKDDLELMNIPHYVKYNRSQPGKIQMGESVPDLPLTSMQGCGTSLLGELSPHSSLPVVLVAGSYT